ncbi:MAG: [FeFe] hydrogenase H-cluster radical SAM maturase HydE [Oscillospiraceae bacterium]|nr:[FeFe] hydrogenase H-cluster radical SAM maturase HydE [Oscillospiraceae bacterium]
MHELIEKLCSGAELTQSEWLRVLDERRGDDDEELFARARTVREKYYGREIFTRGLIEFTNYCKNDCRYCGIRRSSAAVHRYRLTEEVILSCCESGYALGFRTFVLQGGEDPYWTDARLVPLIEQMRRRWPDCAITLSLGERSRGSYEKLYAAGANRYLLRHETADAEHYRLLHPPEMSFANRRRCLRDLKDIGYQVGAGFMVGSPGQTNLCLAKDMVFLQELKPHMVGIGPFIPQHDTPFAKEKAGTAELTLFLLALIRLMLPRVLLPATTALGTIDPRGREKGILAGANVVMPNLSPVNVRGDYQLYDNKICTGEEAAECRGCLERRIASVGCTLSQSRGDFLER